MITHVIGMNFIYESINIHTAPLGFHWNRAFYLKIQEWERLARLSIADQSSIQPPIESITKILSVLRLNYPNFYGFCLSLTLSQ